MQIPLTACAPALRRAARSSQLQVDASKRSRREDGERRSRRKSALRGMLLPRHPGIHRRDASSCSGRTQPRCACCPTAAQRAHLRGPALSPPQSREPACSGRRSLGLPGSGPPLDRHENMGRRGAAALIAFAVRCRVLGSGPLGPEVCGPLVSQPGLTACPAVLQTFLAAAGATPDRADVREQAGTGRRRVQSFSCRLRGFKALGRASRGRVRSARQGGSP